MFNVIILVAIWLVGRNTPRAGVGINGKFRQLIRNDHAFHFDLGWDFVTEGNAIIINAETNREEATRFFAFFKINCSFIAVIADCMLFAPFGAPSVVNATRICAHHTKAIRQRGSVFKRQA